MTRHLFERLKMAWATSSCFFDVGSFRFLASNSVYSDTTSSILVLSKTLGLKFSNEISLFSSNNVYSLNKLFSLAMSDVFDIQSMAMALFVKKIDANIMQLRSIFFISPTRASVNVDGCVVLAWGRHAKPYLP